jgi:hypothetical protein
MEKTPVEWLLKQLQENFPKQMSDMYESSPLLLEDLVIKSKVMEEDQRIEMWTFGWDDGHQCAKEECNEVLDELKDFDNWKEWKNKSE